MVNDLALGHDGRDVNPQLAAFLRDAQERGSVRADELEALQHELDLDDESLEALRGVLVEAEVEIEESSDEHELELDLEPAPTALGTADSLQLFLNEVGRHSLLTAAEEVMLA
jgi:RNA polymerase primary sigma factor